MQVDSLKIAGHSVPVVCVRSTHATSSVNRFQTVRFGHAFALVILLVASLPLIAQDQMAFEPHSEGLESRALAERVAGPAGSTLFETLPAETTGVDFDGAIPDVARYFRELTALGGYFAVATGDVDGDGLTDFMLTNPTGDNRLYRNLGGFRFRDITAAAGLGEKAPWSSGASFVDIDNDGDLDLFICRFMEANQLFISQGNGPDGVPQFTEQAAAFGLDQTRASMHMAFADYDLDGDLDGYLATTYAPPPRGVKFRVRYEGKKPIVVDELREYWELIYLPGDRAHLSDSGQVDHLFRNDGGSFTDVSEAAGIEGTGSTLGVVWWDFNADNLPDLYIANDFLGADKLYLNRGNGRFEDVIADTVSHTPWSSMGVDFGDLDNDGRLDLVASDMLGTSHYRRSVMQGEISKNGWFLDHGAPRQYTRNAVFLNTGTGRMLEAAHLTGMAATDWTWAPRVEDFDNDGKQDVFFTNGMIRDVQHSDLSNYATRTLGEGSRELAKFWSEQAPQAEANLAFRNLGNLEFEKTGPAWGLDHVGVSYGVATADFDNDGDLDLIVNNASRSPLVLRNRSGAQERSIRVELRGRKSNRFGIGATIRIEAGGSTQIRHVAITHGWESGGEPVSHFGLGDTTLVDRLSVDWPSGIRQSFEQLPACRLFRITEPESGAQPKEAAVTTPMFAPSVHLDSIAVAPHRFDDVAFQPLLPRRHSWTRFAAAWADVDQDGDSDVYVGGESGEAGRLLLNNGGVFTAATVPAFAATSLSSDRAAAFADLNGDDHLDLIIVNGGSPFPGAPTTPMAYLFLNDGTGGFIAASDNLRFDIAGSGACVAIDGPLVFIGGGSMPHRYPKSSKSRLLRVLDGTITDITPDSFESIRLATDAVWVDVNGNQRNDLVVTTEWGPIRIFLNHPDGFRESTESGLASLTGWWNCIATADIDKDGDLDFAVGNLGLNTSYSATPDAPARLYHGRFLGLERPEIVESYFENGREFPVRGFDQLSRSLPPLRQKFLNFHQYSSKALDGVIPADELAAAQRHEAHTFASGILRNDGTGRFTFEPFPRIAQIAPINDIAFIDADGDGHLDLVCAQNDFSLAPVTGRADGGLGLLLTGDGRGNFTSVDPSLSGIVVPGDARSIHTSDLDGDDRPDLVFGLPGVGFETFVSRGR